MEADLERVLSLDKFREYNNDYDKFVEEIRK